MIPFPFNENRFPFYVADHLLVGQLCSNPKSDSLLSCLKVTQCSTSEIRDAPLYNSCSLPIQQDHCQHPQNANPDGSMLEGTAQHIWRPFGGGGVEGHIMPPHIFKVGLKVNTKVYLDVLKSVVIPWCNQVAGGRPWVWQQDLASAHKSKETLTWLQKKCYNFVPFSHWPSSSPDLNPLDSFAWSYIKNITNMTSHNTKASLITTICRAPTATCGKGMLPVPDTYRGSDWGWKRLYWIDVSLTRITTIMYDFLPVLIFSFFFFFFFHLAFLIIGSHIVFNFILGILSRSL